MAWGNVLVLGAHTTIRQAITDVRAREADFAVFRLDGNLFAFRLWELEAVKALDLAAVEALGLAPWKRSATVRDRRDMGPPPGPPRLADPLAPSTLRVVILDDIGEPLHVEDARPFTAMLGGLSSGPLTDDKAREVAGVREAQQIGRIAPVGDRVEPLARMPYGTPPGLLVEDGRASIGEWFGSASPSAEGTSIIRHPAIEAVGERRRGAMLLLRIDLKAAADGATTGDPIAFGNLLEDWRELAVSALVSSPQLEFAAGANEGTIRVRRGLPSVACTIPAVVTAEGEQRIEVTVVFLRDDRWCGTAQRTFTAAATSPVSGTVHFVGGATAPDLTIHIHRDAAMPGRLQWLLWPALAHRGSLAGDVWSETRLDGEPSAFMRAVLQAIAGARPGEHLGILHAIGEILWDKIPERVRTTYWQLRDKLGDSFSIQFVTDEPAIPWELARPLRDETVNTRLLAETHPVARALPAYCDRLCATLPAEGMRLTIAPDYSRRRPPATSLPPLVHAQDESATLHEQFQALRVPGTALQLLHILEDREGSPVQLLHFAGHGTFGRQALLSSIALEDADLRVAQIRHQGVALGEKYRTFVIFNACEVGATGEVLGDVGGWAEAFAYRRFGGFLAPLWAVFDGHAKLAMEQFLEAVLVKGLPIGVALRDVRGDFADTSATFLSYLYYGDVNARFG